MKKNRKLILAMILLQVMYFLIAYIITSAYETDGYKASVADSILLGLTYVNIYTYITVVLAISVFSIIGRNMYYGIIIRSGGGNRMFLNMAVKAGISSACVAVCHVFSIAVWSKAMGREWINWSAPNSVYRYICAGHTTDISFIRMIIFALIGSFVLFYIISLIMLINGWMFGRIVALAVVVIVFFAEKYSGGSIIFGLLLPSYETIAESYGIIKSILVGTVIIIGLYVAGSIMIKRKDYIN